VNRRSFLGYSSAAVAAGAIDGRLGAADPKAALMTIIDTHQHLWDLTTFRLPWVKPGTPLGRSFLLSDYQAAAAGLGIVKTIYMEVDVEPSQQQAEADFVRATCSQPGSGMVAGVVSGRPAADGFAAYVEQFRGGAVVKGIRQVLHGSGTPAGYCLDPKFIRGVRLLGDLGLRFDLCMRSAELPDAGKLIDASPDTAFILDHCGNARVHDANGGKAPDRAAWQRDLAALAGRKNLVCKVSGLVNTATKGAWGPDDLAPIINHVLDSFGPDRVIFASDWPVCTTVASLAEWVTALTAVVRDRPAADQRKLFHDNAVRVYGLT
jgi:predicted TIM-barrel fold metal-dependent hydrolase